MTKDEILENIRIAKESMELTKNQSNNLQQWLLWITELNTHVKVGDIVQIDPEFGDIFGGHLVVVTEVYGWGIKGYIMYLKKRKDCFFKTFHYKDIVPCGKAKWFISEEIKCK